MNLLEHYQSLTTADERAAWVAGLSQEDRDLLEQALVAEFATVRAEAPSVDRNASLAELRDGIAAVREVSATVAAEQAELEAAAAEIEAEVVPAAAEDADDSADDDAGQADAGAADSAASETPAEAAPVTPEAVAPAPVAPAAEQVVEPVAAAAPPPPRPRRTFPTTAVRPPRHAPTPAARAGARITRTPDGQPLDNLRDIAPIMVERRSGFGSVPAGHSEKVAVARLHLEYPDAHRFTEGQTAEQMDTLIAAAVEDRVARWRNMGGVQTLTAAAAELCGPVNVFYGIDVLGDDARPALANLTPFDATRGGITLRRPPSLADVEATDAVGEWTNADSAAADPDEPSTLKQCHHVECPTPETTEVDAIYRCLEFDNLFARTQPEVVAAWTNLVMTSQARFAERRIMTAIGNGSTQVNADRVLGAARDTLANVDILTSGMRDRHRVSPTAPVEVWMPWWAVPLIRVDIARQMPGDGLGALSVSDAQILGWFRDRNAIPVFFRDGETGQNIGAQNDGDLLGFPERLVWYAFFPGTWLQLGLPEMDLGLVRDSTLNARNDYRIFAETWEATALRGVESIRVDQPTCPSGTSSGTEDIVDLLNCAAS